MRWTGEVHSAFLVGLVSVAQFVPQLVLAPLSGSIADRGNRLIQAVVGRFLVAAGSGVLGLWVWLSAVNESKVIFAAFVVGLGFVVSGPAQEALIPALVRPGELAEAIALNTAPPLLARAAGPAVGAIVATTVGPAAAFLVASTTNFLFMLILLFLRVETRAARNDTSDTRVRTGLLYPLKDRPLLLLLGGITAIGIGADPVITLTPSLARSLGAGSKFVGAFASAYGIGAGITFFAISSLRRRLGLPRLASVGLVALGGGMASAGLVTDPILAMVSFLIAGAGTGMALTSLTTQMQQRVPDDLRGRIMALWAMAFIGTRPLAAALNGATADKVSLAAAFVLVATIVAVFAWISRPTAISKLSSPRP